MRASTQLPANSTPGRSLRPVAVSGRTFRWGKSWSARRSERTIGAPLPAVLGRVRVLKALQAGRPSNKNANY